MGVLYGRYDLLDRLTAYKVRPAPKDPPGKFETGTGNFEGMVRVDPVPPKWWSTTRWRRSSVSGKLWGGSSPIWNNELINQPRRALEQFGIILKTKMT